MLVIYLRSSRCRERDGCELAKRTYCIKNRKIHKIRKIIAYLVFIYFYKITRTFYEQYVLLREFNFNLFALIIGFIL